MPFFDDLGPSEAIESEVRRIGMATLDDLWSHLSDRSRSDVRREVLNMVDDGILRITSDFFIESNRTGGHR